MNFNTISLRLLFVLSVSMGAILPGAPVERIKIELICHVQADSPQMAGTKMSRKYDILDCGVRDTTGTEWQLTRAAIAYALGRDGVSVVNENVATADFKKTVGRKRLIIGIAIRGGLSVAVGSISDLGAWGGLLGLAGGQGLASGVDKFIQVADSLAPQEAAIRAAMGPDSVTVTPYGVTNVLLLVSDRGQDRKPIISTMWIYVEVSANSREGITEPTTAPIS